MDALERFLRYISFDTASDERSETVPSTEKQMALIRELRTEMEQLGLTDLYTDEGGNLIGTLPASGSDALPVALVAHVDTSPEASGANVHPRRVLWTGEDLELGAGERLSEQSYPALRDLRGQELIVTDGTTLLGADDKAGVAEIMTMAERLLTSGRPHGEVRLVFTTDEETGQGTRGLDVEALQCAWGYTVDGGALGECEYENFNAAQARVRITGVGIHPGSAKGVMVNASAVAMEFHGLLPPEQVPERTEGYEGFIHLTGMIGEVPRAELGYILRDHDREKLEEKKRCLMAAAQEIDRRYGAGTAQVAMKDTYRNMREKIEPHMHLIERARAAFRKNGIEPKDCPIRGGTDGALLSWQGLPCPNLSAGGYNFHGVHEFIPAQAPDKMADVLCDLICSFAEK